MFRQTITETVASHIKEIKVMFLACSPKYNLQLISDSKNRWWFQAGVTPSFSLSRNPPSNQGILSKVLVEREMMSPKSCCFGMGNCILYKQLKIPNYNTFNSAGYFAKTCKNYLLQWSQVVIVWTNIWHTYIPRFRLLRISSPNRQNLIQDENVRKSQ